MFWKRYGGNQAAIVWLLAVGRASIAEEPLLVGVSVEAEVLKGANARPPRTFADVALKIEQRMSVARGRHEKSPRALVGDEKTIDELRPDFIGLLRDARPEGRPDIRG